MKTIIFANQKGGVLKTTSTFAVADALKKKGLRVLMVDTDSQCNLSMAFGINPLECKLTCEDILNHETPIKDIVLRTRAGDIVPGSRNFQMAEGTYGSDLSLSLFLKKALTEVSEDYDYCLIDCPPLLSFLFAMDVYAADYIVIPAEICGFSMDALGNLFEKVLRAQKTIAPTVKIAGILMTKVNARTKDFVKAKEVYGNIAQKIGCKVFENYIPQSTKMATSVEENISIFDLAPDSSVAKAYMKFTEELIDIVK